MTVTPSSPIVGVFTDRSLAEQAVEALYHAGFEQEQMRYSVPGNAGSFFEGLKSFFTGTSTYGGGLANDADTTAVRSLPKAKLKRVRFKPIGMLLMMMLDPCPPRRMCLLLSTRQTPRRLKHTWLHLNKNPNRSMHYQEQLESKQQIGLPKRMWLLPKPS